MQMQIPHSLVVMVVALGIFGNASPTANGACFKSAAPVAESCPEPEVVNIKTVYLKVKELFPDAACTDDFSDFANVQLIADTACSKGITFSEKSEKRSLFERSPVCQSFSIVKKEPALEKRTFFGLGGNGMGGGLNFNPNINLNDNDNEILEHDRGYGGYGYDGIRRYDEYPHRGYEGYEGYDRFRDYEGHGRYAPDFYRRFNERFHLHAFNDNENQNANQNINDNQNVDANEREHIYKREANRGRFGLDAFNDNGNQDINQNINANQNLLANIDRYDSFFGKQNGGFFGSEKAPVSGTTPISTGPITTTTEFGVHGDESLSTNNQINFSGDNLNKRHYGHHGYDHGHHGHHHGHEDFGRFHERVFSDNDNQDVNQNINSNQNTKANVAERPHHKRNFGGHRNTHGHCDDRHRHHNGQGCVNGNHNHNNIDENRNVNKNQNININKNHNTPETPEAPCLTCQPVVELQPVVVEAPKPVVEYQPVQEVQYQPIQYIQAPAPPPAPVAVPEYECVFYAAPKCGVANTPTYSVAPCGL